MASGPFPEAGDQFSMIMTERNKITITNLSRIEEDTEEVAPEPEEEDESCNEDDNESDLGAPDRGSQ